MKTVFTYLPILTLIMLFISIDATVGGNGSRSAKKMNFYGTLTTHAGNTFSIDHITIEGRNTKIKVYEKPAATDKTNHEIHLSYNPETESVVSNVEFSEIKTISVPRPKQRWIFQKGSRNRKHKFLEIEIVSNSGTTRNYLTKKSTSIRCNEIDDAGPIEKEVPMAAIKTLTIEGYEITENNKK